MIDLSADAESLRSEVRSWAASNVPPDWRATLATGNDDDWVTFHRGWFTLLRRAGLATPNLPSRWGGGANLENQVVIQEELARADSPDPRLFAITLNHLPATLLEFGTEEQIAKYLPPALDGQVWCQGFSEPGAGSDLASLRTSAVRKGDLYIVNGQKVWSSLAMFADWCLLLVRTDPTASKRRGISYLLMDMTSPGVEVRPIRQITGDAEFCEIFLDNVEIPVKNLIGEENGGWAVTQATLAAERGPITLGFVIRLSRSFELLLSSAARAGRDGRPADDPVVQQRLTRLYIKIRAAQQLCYRMIRAMARDEELGAEAAIVKLSFSELVQELTRLGVELTGMTSQQAEAHPRGDITQSGAWMIDYLNSWMWTISGGSNEVLRTMVGDRVLGLPRDAGMN